MALSPRSDLDRFASDLFAAAVEDAPVDTLLRLLTGIRDVGSANLFSMCVRSGRPLEVSLHGQDPENWPLYRDQFGALDPWRDAAIPVWRMRPMTPGSQIVPAATLKASDYISQFVRPRRIHGDLTAMMRREDVDRHAVLMIYGPYGSDALSRETIAALKARLPAIERFLTLRARAVSSALEIAFLRRLAARGGGAGALVDGRLRIVHATDGFDSPPLDRLWRARGGRLALADRGAEVRLARFAAAVAGRDGSDLDLTVPAGEGLLEAEALLVRDPLWRLDRTLVLVRARSGSPAVDETARRAQRLMALYGLTVSEAQVTATLAEGRSPREIADARGASLATVRTQLREARRKLGGRSLAEAVARVLSL